VDHCFHHPDVETGRQCSRCGRPACPACLKQASVGSHCFECRKSATPSRREQVRVQRAIGATPAYVTIGLIATNVIIFLVTHDLTRFGRTSIRASVVNEWALYAPRLDVSGEWYRMLTSGFLHFDIRHLAFNMIVLFLLGRRLERRVGGLRMLGIYVAALVSGSFGALLLSPNSFTAGASGAVYGLMSAAYLAEKAAGGDPWNDGLGSLIIINIVFTFMIPNISIGGHFGGLAGGALVVLAMGRSALSGVGPPRALAAVMGVALLGVGGCIAVAPLWTSPVFQ
jgi:membrane associated rhomboid family serine protease